MRVRWWLLITTVTGLVNAQQPNVVFIMVDDMGWNDVSFHGSDQILTPNIDALAYRGVILQQYYSEAVCTPARTALLTGKYPMRLGMHGLPLYNSEDRGIPLTERLLPSYMKELGYATHLVGKWHVGMSRPEFLPTARGYDSHYGMRGGLIDYYTHNNVETWPNGRLLYGLDLFDNDIPQEEEQRYIVDALTDRAIKIIYNHNESQPLFLHLTHNAPHSGTPGGKLQPPLYSAVKNRHIAHTERRLYAEVVNSIDRNVGRVVRALGEKGMLDDTIIIFASDNGAPTIGEMNNWGVNLPLRGKKFTPWEGGVRVPAFIWHSSFRPRVWNGLMHITDWLPTLTAAAGGQFNGKIDGINQWDSIVQDGESRRRDVLLTLEDSDLNRYASYRAGDYKIVVGNVTGLSNGYYGAEFMRIKGAPPDYYPALRSCEVARIFEAMGMHLDFYEVLAMRGATAIKQEDNVRDPTPCVPTPTRGCLFNVRRDPTESHDLWNIANKIAVLLTSRLRALWAMQNRRGPPNLQAQGDPVNFDFVWTPWLINGSDNLTNATSNNVNRTSTDLFSSRQMSGAVSSRNSTVANVINCDGESGLRNFLCILRTVF
ncbi:arylsulfatase B-like isoform X3 [Ostrinia furnacalis]|uniref:arylsulfatase B-like isoform X3 n=1 Tax=Ostrinia furnacalis TaxID=93504 RepID=UPI00103AD120|nr:arylsulfatase B-like isoform X3 [Ostrinia furnacalis]